MDFAGFTLTQFRHSYIQIDQTAAVLGWNLASLVDKPKAVLVFGAWFCIRPAGIMSRFNGPEGVDHGTDGSRYRFGNDSR